MQFLTDAEQIESSAIRELFIYWRSKCHEGRIPRRADLDPIDMRRLLPKICIVEFEQQPFRVKFRLAGTQVVEATGFEFTGKYLDEIALPEARTSLMECYQTASRTRRPLVARIGWQFSEHLTGFYDLGVLPLDDDGENANRAVILECYDRLQRRYNSSLGGLETSRIGRR